MPTARSHRTKPAKQNLGEVLLVRVALDMAFLSARAADTDWRQFRGPNASGVAERSTVPTTWNLETGENILWRVPRREVATWSTPTAVMASDYTQIVVNGWRTIGGYDFVTGKAIWWLSGGGDAPIPTPVAVPGLMYLTSAHGNWRPMRAVRLDATGDIMPPEIEKTNAGVVWVHPRQATTCRRRSSWVICSTAARTTAW